MVTQIMHELKTSALSAWDHYYGTKTQ